MNCNGTNIKVRHLKPHDDIKDHIYTIDFINFETGAAESVFITEQQYIILKDIIDKVESKTFFPPCINNINKKA